ncbi:MAG: dimethylsulfoniopropionate lyase [Rhodobacteraceae bacterium]|nr:dimethylsulfoniopropionate lyase [Paracoccaceae bacterium]
MSTMSAMIPDADEARRLLATPPGQPGSGRLRYGAAMALHGAGLLDGEVLEAYRICALLDGEDPLAVLRARGGRPPPPAPPAPPSAALATAALVAEADLYLAGLGGPGPAEARAGIAAARQAADVPAPGAPHPVVQRWLGPALAALGRDRPGLAAAIAAAAPHLRWGAYDSYPRARIGDAFAEGHAFAPLAGEEAPFLARDFELGLFLIAPRILYRDHRHRAPELYAPLTGPHSWRFGPDRPLLALPAHRPVWNDPFRPHATRVGDIPFLCLYAWTRDVSDPAEVVEAADWARLEAPGAAP